MEPAAKNLNLEEWVTPPIAWELIEDPPIATFAFICLRVAKHTGLSLESSRLQNTTSKAVTPMTDSPSSPTSDRFAPPLFLRRGTLVHVLPPQTTGPNTQRSRGRFDIFLGRNLDGNGTLSWCDVRTAKRLLFLWDTHARLLDEYLRQAVELTESTDGTEDSEEREKYETWAAFLQAARASRDKLPAQLREAADRLSPRGYPSPRSPNSKSSALSCAAGGGRDPMRLIKEQLCQIHHLIEVMRHRLPIEQASTKTKKEILVMMGLGGELGDELRIEDW